jgi:hypothetical protein
MANQTARKPITRPQIENLINRLDFDFKDFDIGRFISHVEGYLGRKIILVPWRDTGGLFGAWVSCGDEEYILYKSHLAPLHKFHTLLHELGHRILGHETLAVSKTELHRLIRGASAAPLMAQLRSTAESQDDGEAELFADMIQERVLLAGSSMDEAVNSRQFEEFLISMRLRQ